MIHQHKRLQHNNNIVCVCVCVIMHACDNRECVCKHAFHVCRSCVSLYVCVFIRHMSSYVCVCLHDVALVKEISCQSHFEQSQTLRGTSAFVFVKDAVHSFLFKLPMYIRCHLVLHTSSMRMQDVPVIACKCTYIYFTMFV